jgi:Na+/H+ antiporter NhaD/arsenite permease-like protein
MKKVIFVLLALIVGLLAYGLFLQQHPAASATHAEHPSHLGEVLPIWSSLPFVGILLSIALFPVLAPHFWHHHFGKVSAFWSIVTAIPFAIAYGEEAVREILHIYVADYIPFIILLWSLFTVAGGILVEGTLKGTPRLNTIFLTIGAFLASLVGTTGASMLLIRPVLRANAERKNKVHIIIFFIFLVSNIGGSLTPLGDPPLFLGFLHFVPFFWTLKLIKPMGLVSGILLILFYLVDRHYYRRHLSLHREPSATHAAIAGEPKAVAASPIRIRGLYNLLFLGGIIGGVLMSGLVRLGSVEFMHISIEIQNLLRDVILVLMGFLSLYFTPQSLREGNGFTWAPIKEVAYLFAGIFMCMIPTLAILKAGAEGALGFLIQAVKEPAHYFWATGSLSSFLDNAPTYLTFLNTELGNFYAGMPEKEAVQRLIAEHEIFLMAVSTGAVFMGANTYIGNAPNFMVKSIAEENEVKMPSFFGYMLWSIGILIPCFVLVTILFF